MFSTRVLWQKKFLQGVLLIVVFAFVAAACGMRSSSNATGSTLTPTSSSIRTSGTVPGYGKAYGCPSDVVVSTAAAAPDVTVAPKEGSTVVNAHRGDVIEVLMPFGVMWRGPTTSQGILQLQQPSGYVWKPSNSCIWGFIAKSTGTVALDFFGSAICKKVSLCVPSVEVAAFTIKVA